jgi:hypothetical protein
MGTPGHSQRQSQGSFGSFSITKEQERQGWDWGPGAGGFTVSFSLGSGAHASLPLGDADGTLQASLASVTGPSDAHILSFTSTLLLTLSSWLPLCLTKAEWPLRAPLVSEN